MIRLRSSVCFVLLAAVLSFSAGKGYAADAETILLGVNYPLTGPYSVEGLDQIRAARLAVDELNRTGGILGKRVELVTADSASDVLISKLNVNRLIDEGCRMIFGGASSAVAIAAAEICQRRGVPFFATLSYSTATTLEHGKRMAFRECNDSLMSARCLAGWLTKRFSGGRYFFITADYTWGWSTEASIRAVTHTQDRERHPVQLTQLGEIDFSAPLAKAREFDPDVLVLVLFGKDMAYALRQAHAMGLKERCQIVVPNLTLGMAERTGHKALHGVVGTLPWYWKLPYLEDYPRGREFVEGFVQRYNRYPSTSGASAYSVVGQYASAVERAGGFDAAGVVRALEGHRYSLLKGEQWWRPLDHQNVQRVYLVRGASMEKVLEDRFRLDFFDFLSSRPGEEIVISPEAWKRLRVEAGLPPHLEPLEQAAPAATPPDS